MDVVFVGHSFTRRMRDFCLETVDGTRARDVTGPLSQDLAEAMQLSNNFDSCLYN